jgi:hypothetical protein
VKQILDAISRMQKGHWGLVEPACGVSIQTAFLDGVRSSFRGHLLEIDCRSLPKPVPEVSEAVMSRVGQALQIARESGKRAVCCALRDFHHLEIESQIAALSATRSIRESSSDIPLITVLIGAWNRYRIPQVWKQFHPTSPCPDQKCIRTIQPYSVADLQASLLDDRWISSPASELDEITVEALLEFTGGDACLIDEVLSTLRMSGRALRDYPETLTDVASSETVVESIENRLSAIGEKAKGILCSIIRQQRKLVDPRQLEIEDLRLAGFIRIERTGDLCLALLNSVLMEKVLRKNHGVLVHASNSIATVNDLVNPSHAINSHAYRLVLQIETILRNTMLEYFSDLKPEGWRHGTKDIKIPGNPAELHADDIRQLGKQLIAALYPDVDFSAFEESSKRTDKIPVPIEEGRKKPKLLSVVDAALEWQGRSGREGWVRSAEDSLPQFITTGALMNVYLGKDLCEPLLKACFNDREQARTFFAQFLSLRSAVAHNHSLGLSTVEDLIALKRELCSRLGASRN